VLLLLACFSNPLRAGGTEAAAASPDGVGTPVGVGPGGRRIAVSTQGIDADGENPPFIDAKDF
jgi:hypothetical protein